LAPTGPARSGRPDDKLRDKSVIHSHGRWGNAPTPSWMARE